MKSSLKSPLVPALVALGVASCVSSSFDPKTGQVDAYAPSSSLVNEGNQQFAAMKRQKRTTGAHGAQIRRVAARLKAAVPTRGTSWEIVEFQDSTPNAFALPGGKIGINSGMFQVIRSDAELAAVLGHEMAHVTLNHAQSKRDTNAIVGIGALVLDEVMAAQGGPTGLASTAGQYGVLLPYSRSAELQADKLGTIYMAKAGYDPEQAVSVWRRFAGWKQARGQGGQPEFTSTHPVDETRIRELQAYMPTAKAAYRR